MMAFTILLLEFNDSSGELLDPLLQLGGPGVEPFHRLQYPFHALPPVEPMFGGTYRRV